MQNPLLDRLTAVKEVLLGAGESGPALELMNRMDPLVGPSGLYRRYNFPNLTNYRNYSGRLVELTILLEDEDNVAAASLVVQIIANTPDLA